MEPILKTEALSVGYHGTAILDGVEISVRSGEILTLIGPNGGGKSTILRTLTRQLRPVAGTVWLDGAPLSQWTDSQLARTLSVVLTRRMEPELMTCGQVVAAGRYPYTGRLGLLTAADREKVAEAMELVHVSDLAQRDFNQVSDGQRQRVLLAKAICQEPKLLVMDEPTSFLDIRHKLELLSLLRALVRSRGLAVILSLHELDLAQKVSDRLLCIGHGRVDRQGTPEEIFSGTYLSQLYGVTAGTLYAPYGSAELERTPGTPQVFVIGGGGSGIPVYRRLQRQGIPFGAGVLSANDVEYPVAAALAAKLIVQPAFQPVGEEAVQAAMAVLAGCDRLICCLDTFGSVNQGNQRLVDYAAAHGIPIEYMTHEMLTAE